MPTGARLVRYKCEASELEPWAEEHTHPAQGSGWCPIAADLSQIEILIFM